MERVRGRNRTRRGRDMVRSGLGCLLLLIPLLLLLLLLLRVTPFFWGGGGFEVGGGKRGEGSRSRWDQRLETQSWKA